MIKVEQRSYYQHRLWVTPAMEEFAKKIKFDCEVGVIEDYHKVYHVDQYGLMGNVGPRGCIGPRTQLLPTDVFDERDLTLIIKFKVDNQINLDDLRDNLIITRGGNNRIYEPVKINEVGNYVDQEYQVHHWKKPGFNELFAAAKVMIPELTEKKLIKIFDGYDLIDENDGEELLLSETKVRRVKVGVRYEITVTILSIDLVRNSDLLVEFLNNL